MALMDHDVAASLVLDHDPVAPTSTELWGGYFESAPLNPPHTFPQI